MSLLQTVDLRRVFSETGEDLEILKGVNFEMETGELVALTGSSGSGKSTFLNLVGMLDTPSCAGGLRVPVPALVERIYGD